MSRVGRLGVHTVYPNIGPMTKARDCVFCGFTFLAMTPDHVVDAHIQRCEDKKIEEARWHQARGERLTSKGWVKSV